MLLATLLYCRGEPGEPVTSATASLDDAELIVMACGGCHAVPEAADLPRGIWDTIILPRMGHFMGIYAFLEERAQLLAANEGAREQLLKANIYPVKPTLRAEEWQRIRNHYLTSAPAQLEVTLLPIVGEANFTARFPDVFMSPPSASYVGFRRDGSLLMADINKGGLFAFDTSLRPSFQLATGPGLTDLLEIDGTAYGTVIGSFSPTDVPSGKLVALGPRGATSLAEGLQRPTSLVAAQLDEDPERELLVTEFGKWTGAFSRWDRSPTGGFQRTNLREVPGAIKVITEYADSTYLVLFGQGRESIVRFTVSDGQLSSGEEVLTFPPSYGSSALRKIDWNHDGYPDLLYVNGDNADYYPVLKPYHGIRVFLGDENGRFEKALFIPFPGAYDAVVADFDLDGDQDIAAISFFPDYRGPEASNAVLFQREQPQGWTAQALPAAGTGRWIRLAAGDPDRDGDLDLLAGSLAMETVPDRGEVDRWVKQGLPFIFWENRAR
ncbi:VCBS repeat-containing protein [Lewinella sp. W8]|uniref:FG-GAP repeat domain-containing protein n=1 Tax=Lewinella sp. W8 TaxID=2528208 RepID=UPI001565661C|nr:VCBS repeat-containing protein [Lewinella sp. W8]